MSFANAVMSHTKGRELDGTETFSASFNTGSLPIKGLSNYAIQVVRSSASSLDVDIELQASIDGSNWVDVEDSQDANVTTDGSTLFDVADAGYSLVRVKFTFNAGSCVLKVVASAKE